jgi:hypothetical protein
MTNNDTLDRNGSQNVSQVNMNEDNNGNQSFIEQEVDKGKNQSMN